MVEKSPDLRDDTPMSEAAGSSTGPSVGPRKYVYLLFLPMQRVASAKSASEAL
ncbi:hypothetical protein ACI68E_003104 [Malassezia pachydermatis]